MLVYWQYDRIRRLDVETGEKVRLRRDFEWKALAGRGERVEIFEFGQSTRD